MAASYKILGQAAPTNTNDTTLYTVPASTETIVSSLIVANIGTVATTFNVAIRPNGDTLANQHYIAKAVPIAGQDSTTLTLGLTMDASDVVTVSVGTANAIAFNLFGAELPV